MRMIIRIAIILSNIIILGSRAVARHADHQEQQGGRAPVPVDVEKADDRQVRRGKGSGEDR